MSHAILWVASTYFHHIYFTFFILMQRRVPNYRLTSKSNYIQIYLNINFFCFHLSICVYFRGKWPNRHKCPAFPCEGNKSINYFKIFVRPLNVLSTLAAEYFMKAGQSHIPRRAFRSNILSCTHSMLDFTADVTSAMPEHSWSNIAHLWKPCFIYPSLKLAAGKEPSYYYKISHFLWLCVRGIRKPPCWAANEFAP